MALDLYYLRRYTGSMTAIKFGPESDRSVFLTMVNSDLTEGRGAPRVHSVHLKNRDAERAAYGSDVQGTDGTVYEVPLNIGSAGRPIWGWLNTRTPRFGPLPAHVVRATGVRYGDRQKLPNLSDAQWVEYAALAKSAGHNPVAEQYESRRSSLNGAPDIGQSQKLFVVVSADEYLVAILDTDDEAEAKVMFATTITENPELEGHVLRELNTGETGGAMWGEALDVPGAHEVTEAILGRYPDGTVFLVPDTMEEYILWEGELLTSDGFVADLAGLNRAGVRPRTDEDVKAISYLKMQRMVEAAARQG